MAALGPGQPARRRLAFSGGAEMNCPRNLDGSISGLCRTWGLIPELLRGQSLLLNLPPLVPVNGVGVEVPLELLEAPLRPVPVELVLQAPGQQLCRMSLPSHAAGPGRVRAPFGLPPAFGAPVPPVAKLCCKSSQRGVVPDSPVHKEAPISNVQEIRGRFYFGTGIK